MLFRSRPLNQKGATFLQTIANGADVATMNPTEVLSLLNNAKAIEDEGAKVFLFQHNAQLIWKNEYIVQCIWNLRDAFKPSGSCLYLLVPLGTVLPNELKDDIVVLNDSLPNAEQIDEIVGEVAKSAGYETVSQPERVRDTLTGLSAFAVEQTLALSARKDGFDLVSLWDRKRKVIEQTPGLTVWKGGETFDDVGGYDNVKGFLRKIATGRNAPKAIVFIDEIEKSLAGSAGDSTGVSQDQLRCLLTEMQDTEAQGLIFIGAGGSGKSAIAKATGNDAGIPTISLDLGALQSSLVGSSQARIRAAFDVIRSVSGGKALWIATCNSIGVLPPELRRRFTLEIGRAHV